MRTSLTCLGLLTALSLSSTAGCSGATSPSTATSGRLETADASACGANAIASVSSANGIEELVAGATSVFLAIDGDETADSTATLLVSGSRTGELSTLFQGSSTTAISSMSVAGSTLFATMTGLSSRGDAQVEATPIGGGATRTVLDATFENGVQSAVSDGATVYAASGNDIVAAPVVGGDARVVYTGQFGAPANLVVDGASLYWQETPASGWRIMTAPTTTGALGDARVAVAPLGEDYAWTVESGILVQVAVELTGPGGSVTLTATTPTGTTTTLDGVSSLPGMRGTPSVAAFAGRAYYSVDGTTVKTAPLDGSAAPTTIAAPVPRLLGIAVSGAGDVYYANANCLYRAE